MKRFFANPLSTLYDAAYSIKKLRNDFWLLTGTDENSHSILFGGSLINKDHIASQLFKKKYQGKFIGRRTSFALAKENIIKDFDASLLIIEIGTRFKHILFGEKAFFVPCWFSGWVNIAADLSTCFSRNHRRNLKKIRENKLSYFVRDDCDSFDEFYYDMYLPYVNSRYTDGALVWPYKKMEKKFNKCRCLFVKQDQIIIAGALISFNERTPRFWTLGIKGGNPEYKNEYAIPAIYYFGFDYLKKSGFAEVNTGYTRSFLNDGVLQFKRGLGLNLGIPSRSYYYIKPIDNGNGIGGLGLLQNNPFIHEKRGKMNAAIFENLDIPPNAKLLKSYKHLYAIPGLNEIEYYDLSGKLNNGNKAVFSENGFKLHSKDNFF